MKMTISLPEPKFKVSTKVEYYGNFNTCKVQKMYFVSNKTQSLEPNTRILGYWVYVLDNGEHIQEKELRHYSGDFNKFVVKSTRGYKVVREFSNMIGAIRYVMAHDHSDEWYDLEISYKGYNDIHVWTVIDALLVYHKFMAHDDLIDSIMQEFNYRLNGNKIHYCEDYESAFDIASIMTQVNCEHIIVG